MDVEMAEAEVAAIIKNLALRKSVLSKENNQVGAQTFIFLHF